MLRVVVHEFTSRFTIRIGRLVTAGSPIRRAGGQTTPRRARQRRSFRGEPNIYQSPLDERLDAGLRGASIALAGRPLKRRWLRADGQCVWSCLSESVLLHVWSSAFSMQVRRCCVPATAGAADGCVPRATRQWTNSDSRARRSGMRSQRCPRATATRPRSSVRGSAERQFRISGSLPRRRAGPCGILVALSSMLFTRFA